MYTSPLPVGWYTWVWSPRGYLLRTTLRERNGTEQGQHTVDESQQRRATKLQRNIGRKDDKKILISYGVLRGGNEPVLPCRVMHSQELQCLICFEHRTKGSDTGSDRRRSRLERDLLAINGPGHGYGTALRGLEDRRQHGRGFACWS